MAEGRIRGSQNVDKMMLTADEQALRDLSANELKQYKKLVKKKADLDEASKRELIEKISKFEYNKALDFEKSIHQKRKEAHEQRLADLKLEYDVAETREEKLAAKRKINLEKIAQDTDKVVANLAQQSLTQIDNYIGTYSQYLSQIETRLYGSGKGFRGIADTLKGNLTASPYVKQTAVLENLSKMVEQGIAYNVEQRAFLATVSDRIATTFDAFDASLLQIIRIQQADSTVARLGMESALTNFFNANFGDTSYLSNLLPSVTSSLLGTQSQLGVKGGTEFLYTAQKWLGSLYEAGVSSSTVQSIAQALNAMGTSDISSLQSNEAMYKLLMMATSNANLDIGGLITGGLSSESANVILKSIVDYGIKIAGESNQFVKSQYASMFGLTMSDLTALLNLADKTQEIANTVLTYEQAQKETSSRLSTIASRTSAKDLMDNVFSNILANMGEMIGSNQGLYGAWLAADTLIKAGDISIPIPFVGSIGMGQTAKGALLATAGLSSLIGGLASSLGGNFGLNLSNWNATETRGGTKTWGFTGISAPSVEDLSMSGFSGMSAESRLYKDSILGQKQAEIISGQYDLSENIYEVLSDDISGKLGEILDALITTGVKVRDESALASATSNSASL